MKRWHARLNESPVIDSRRVDDFYAFFLVCYHLKDWLKNDPTVSTATRDAVEPYINSGSWLRLSADIANGFKHLQRRRSRFNPSTEVLRVEPLSDPDEFDAGVQPREVLAVITDTEAWEALQVADEAVAMWDRFLREHGLV